MTPLDAYARFLTARWDEAEKAAREATGHRWSSVVDSPDCDSQGDVYADGNWGRWVASWSETPANGTHIALHDPQATLDDIAAKRAVAFRAKVWSEQHGHTTPGGNGYGETSTAVAVLTMCLEDLAEPFRDHPDHPASREA